MSFSSVSCAACGAVRLSQALTIVTVRVFGALLDFILRDTDTPAWACAVRARGVLCTNAFCGSEAARRLGPTPRGRLKFGRILACRTRTTQNRRVEGAHRSVAGPLSAASARADMRGARARRRESVCRGPCGEWRAAGRTLCTRRYMNMLTTGCMRSGALAVGG